MTAPEHLGSLAFTQPADCPSENAYRRAARSPNRGAIRGVHSTLTEWKHAAFYAWKEQRTSAVGRATGVPAEVAIVLEFRQNRVRDPHNYVGTVCKSIVDGLVIANLWPDDNAEWVTLREPELKVVRVPERTPLVCTVNLYRRG